MIRRFRSTIALTTGAALLVTGLAAAALAQGPDGPRGRRGFGPGRGGFALRALDLTDAQQEQVREVMQRRRAELRETDQRLGAAHEAQREAVQTVPVNEDLIRSTSQALAAAQTDMALIEARIHNEVWTLLTPEQQAKAKELKAQRDARVRQRAQRRPRQQG